MRLRSPLTGPLTAVISFGCTVAAAAAVGVGPFSRPAGTANLAAPAAHVAPLNLPDILGVAPTTTGGGTSISAAPQPTPSDQAPTYAPAHISVVTARPDVSARPAADAAAPTPSPTHPPVSPPPTATPPPVPLPPTGHPPLPSPPPGDD